MEHLLGARQYPWMAFPVFSSTHVLPSVPLLSPQLLKSHTHSDSLRQEQIVLSSEGLSLAAHSW